MGRAGGIARAKGMSKRERQESARNAANARWKIANLKLKSAPVTELNRKRSLARKVKGNSRDRRTKRRIAEQNGARE